MVTAKAVNKTVFKRIFMVTTFILVVCYLSDGAEGRMKNWKPQYLYKLYPESGLVSRTFYLNLCKFLANRTQKTRLLMRTGFISG
jgi:hypothetical protein